ncbi:hypothetical protein M404DRAFT_6103 [Pisolithus tinctorius Marx 270]|uniref:Uncharacterized protein n=1 Tax=Pisolithus tinctorius Marx 270 TaxID=870435 RepID=A0A0C3PWV1_PISTI|nr:hypothetical protein M404DRAFT_6103 [Pisolithus tinctorius Marx 270]
MTGFAKRIRGPVRPPRVSGAILAVKRSALQQTYLGPGGLEVFATSIITESLLWKQAGKRACKLTIGQILHDGNIAKYVSPKYAISQRMLACVPFLETAAKKAYGFSERMSHRYSIVIETCLHFSPSGNEDAGVDRILLFATLGALCVAACFRAEFLRRSARHEANGGKIRKR